MESEALNKVSHELTSSSPPARWAQITCFLMIAMMNLSAWIDLQGLFVEIPLIVPLTPERWTLPSISSLFICAANIVPIVVIILRRLQGKRFSEIPYIYAIIIVGIIACCILAMYWQKTVFIFGRERSVWLLSCIFVLSMLDCTSSLVFFDYMKRFRIRYLQAVFLGEALTSVIPTFLVLAQGVAGETICIPGVNGTIVEPRFTEPRFSVRIFMFAIASIIFASLVAFVVLRWTTIIQKAHAADSDHHPKKQSLVNVEETTASTHMSPKVFLLLLFLNTMNSMIAYGCLPSLSTYALLPFGQKAFYYWSVIIPGAYLLSLLISVYCPTVSTSNIVFQSVLNWILAGFICVIAGQSPCPWLADTTEGSVMIITVWFIMSLISGFIRIIIGNRIKSEWKNEKGMFYYGATAQLGMLAGTIPTYFLINVFEIFVDRKPCEVYCLPTLE